MTLSQKAGQPHKEESGIIESNSERPCPFSFRISSWALGWVRAAEGHWDQLKLAYGHGPLSSWQVPSILRIRAVLSIIKVCLHGIN